MTSKRPPGASASRGLFFVPGQLPGSRRRDNEAHEKEATGIAHVLPRARFLEPLSKAITDPDFLIAHAARRP